jgi:ABC-type transport system substrate-binding protein
MSIALSPNSQIARIARRIRWMNVLGAAIAVCLTTTTTALAAGTHRIGMTASDIPLTTGQTDQGGEGQRFMGYTVYNSLIEWDLTKADKASGLVPALSTSWHVDAKDRTK